MNHENVERVRDYLRDEVPDKKFDMRDYLWRADEEINPYAKRPHNSIKDCGTAACVAGWTCIIFKAQGAGEANGRRLLGLSEDQAEQLFRPQQIPVRNWKNITRTRAVATLTRLLETGTVDWGTE